MSKNKFINWVGCKVFGSRQAEEMQRKCRGNAELRQSSGRAQAEEMQSSGRGGGSLMAGTLPYPPHVHPADPDGI